MNILLVNPPIRENYPPYIQPIGLAIVASMLRNAGHDVKIFDINALRCSRDDAEGLLPDGDFGMVGCSGIITTYGYLCFLVPLLREKYPKAYIVIGGGGITSAPEVYMENIRPDFGVIGEGEHTAVELAERLEKGLPWDDVRGIVYGRAGKMVATQPRPLEKNLDALPWQAFDLLDIETYAKHVKHDPYSNKEIDVIATRGCPMNCNFCYHVFGRGVRYRSVDDVLKEIQFLIDTYKTRAIAFPDECITARKAWITDFCNKVIARGMKFGWSCYSRVDTVDEETMALMAKAGCNYIGFGLESGSQKILDAMGKRTTVAKAKAAYLASRRHIEQTSGTLIYGYPGETAETIEETIQFLAELGHRQNFFHLTAYPGTQVFEDNKERILAKFGSLHNFFLSLADAGIFSINLTDFSDEEYHRRYNELHPMLLDRIRKVGGYVKLEVWVKPEDVKKTVAVLMWMKSHRKEVSIMAQKIERGPA